MPRQGINTQSLQRVIGEKTRMNNIKELGKEQHEIQSKQKKGNNKDKSRNQ